MSIVQSPELPTAEASSAAAMAVPPGEDWQEFQATLASITPRLVVTPALLAVNVGLFLAMAAAGASAFWPSTEILRVWGANYGPETLSGQWWRLLTYAFVHCGVLHLALNSCALWDAGRIVERLTGPVGFLVQYLAAGVVGGAASLFWSPDGVSAGASGAIFGVLGALIGFLLLQRPGELADVLRGLRAGLLVFVGFNLLLGFAWTRIDTAAHVGGLLAGFVCGMILSQPISPAMRNGRRSRNLLAGVAAAGMCLVSLLVLPAGPIDDEAEFRRIAAAEREVMMRFVAAQTSFDRGEIDDAEFAEVVADDVLPPYAVVRSDLERLAGSPTADTEFLRQIGNYAARQQDCFKLLLEGLREQDADMLREYESQMAEAQAFARRLVEQGRSR